VTKINPFLTIEEASGLIRSRQVSPVELVEACFERISALDWDLRAFITVTKDLALAQARRAEAEIARGEVRGALHGIPMAVKDIVYTNGIRTTCNSRTREDFEPTVDATCLQRLYRAGAVLVGKLNMGEFATGAVLGGLVPPARNPWNLRNVPGGSSSGSAVAVASGMCFAALGTDTGGSIRQPAAHCGVIGIRPTIGTVSMDGVVPFSASLDTVGPLARTVRDADLVLRAISDAPSDETWLAPTDRDSATPLSGLVIGIDHASFLTEATDAEVDYAVKNVITTLEMAGAEIVEVEIPMLALANSAFRVILLAEAFAYHRDTLISSFDRYGTGPRDTFLTGGFVEAIDYVQAKQAAALFTESLLRLFANGVDMFLAPTCQRPPPSFEDVKHETSREAPSCTRPFSLAGLPAVSVPCGLTDGGLPVGVQFVGPPLGESRILRIAAVYETAAGWSKLHPTFEV
jgi:aspartyl-tRNA(Asn)/glutamyl-tRNA(Gln) amidotransferase subunit A